MSVIDFLLGLKTQRVELYRNGAKLAVKGNKAALTTDIKQRLSNEKEHILETFETLGIRSNQQLTSVSFAQRRLWFIDTLEQGTNEYNMPGAIEVNGLFDLQLAEQAINTIVERHEILRSVYVAGEDGPVQVIKDKVIFALERDDLSLQSQLQQNEQLSDLINQYSFKPFDLTTDLMLRAGYIHLEGRGPQQKGILWFNMHHIVSDGGSMAVLVKEFIVLYNALSQGQDNPLEPLSLQYSDYVRWQNQYMKGEKLETELEYWKKQLNGIAQAHSLTLDFQRPKHKVGAGEKVIGQVDSELTEQLKQLASHNSMSLFMLLHSAMALVLSRHQNSNDIVVGTPISNRMQPGLASMIGCFVNMLVLRVNTDKPSLVDYFNHVKQVNLDAQTNQNVPFEFLVEHTKVVRSTEHAPLFQILFNMDINTDGQGEQQLDKVSFAPIIGADPVLKFDLEINLSHDANGIEIRWSYDKALFTRERIETMNAHWLRLLRTMVANPQGRLDELEILSPSELNVLLDRASNTQTYPDDCCVHQLFERQVELTPTNVAVAYGQTQLSYLELNQKANQLAHYLLETGLESGDCIAIYLHRSIEMLIGVLAVMKAGGVYVPLEPGYPPKRTKLVLEDASLQTVLTNTALMESLPFAGLDVLMMDNADTDALWMEEFEKHNPQFEQQPTADSLVYLLYTSGSTGKPKGVMVGHREVCNYLEHAKKVYFDDTIEGSVVSSPLCFDATITTLLSPLLLGKSVKLLSDGDETLNELLSCLNDSQPRLFKITPAHMKALAYLNDQNNLVHTRHCIVIGGEQLSSDILLHWRKNWLPRAKYINEYGPTETVVGCCIHIIDERTDNNLIESLPVVSIGRPIANTHLYVLDSNGRLMPDNCCGELYIGGAGVTQGYLNLAQMTEQRFIAAPDGQGRCYKSGDLVRRMANGELLFIGRTDEQVKIRGFRIELAEIEHHIKALEGVDSAQVLVVNKITEQNAQQAQDDKQLVAYIVFNHSDTDQGDLIAQVRQQLVAAVPNYMLPDVYVPLEQWPLTPNGKIDQQALPKPDGSIQQQQYVAPQTELHHALVAIWSNLLQLEIDTIGITTSFFELGGHSLMVIRMLSHIRNEFDIEIALKDVFEYPTVELLCEHMQSIIERQQQLKQATNVTAEQTETITL